MLVMLVIIWALVSLCYGCTLTVMVLTPDIAFEELTQKLAAKQVNLIDVRLPFELVEDGMIPESKNLPRES